MKELLGRSYGGGSGPIKNEGIDIQKYLVVKPEYIVLSKSFVVKHSGSCW